MPSYLHPGVYVEELPSGSKPIEGVATSVASFVGPAVRGPIKKAELVHSFDDYEALYGPVASEGDTMGLAVSAFFLNGGKDVYIGRVAKDGSTVNAAIDVVGESTDPVFTISASSPGKWGNSLVFRLSKESTSATNFDLEVGMVADGDFKAQEAYQGLVMDEASSDFVVTAVNETSLLVKISLAAGAEPDGGNFLQGSLTGEGVAADDRFYVDKIENNMAMTINIDGLGNKKISLGLAGDLALVGDDNKADGDAVALAIQDAVRALGPSVTGYGSFLCSVDAADREFILTSGSTSAASSVVVRGGGPAETDLAALLKLNAESTTVSVHGSANVMPLETLDVSFLNGAAVKPGGSDYQSFFDNILVKKRDVSILVLPGESMAADGSGNDPISHALAHCEATASRMLILDPPSGTELDQASKVDALTLPTSTYSVLYYPWVTVKNPFYDAEKAPSREKTIVVSPSAFAAGMWSKIDGKRGVWKAPAGVEAQLNGAADLEFDVGEGEQDQLNPMGVNCYRQLPGFGRVIWGARTLSTKADPEWRYVSVRRTAIYIEQSIYNGIQWAVFEPNSHLLWSALRTNIGSFMDGMFRSGAFQGETAKDAYFVRCGLGDTMTQADINAGRVIVIVGFAPLKPAEFVIVRLQQKVGEQ